MLRKPSSLPCSPALELTGNGNTTLKVRSFETFRKTTHAERKAESNQVGSTRIALLHPLGESVILLAVWAFSPGEVVSDSQPGLTPKRLVLPREGRELSSVEGESLSLRRSRL